MTVAACANSCNHHHNQDMEHFLYPKQFLSASQSTSTHLSPAQGTTNLLSFLYIRFVFSRVLYEQNYSIFSLLCLASLAQQFKFLRFIHFIANVKSLLPFNAGQYGQLTIYLSLTLNEYLDFFFNFWLV